MGLPATTFDHLKTDSTTADEVYPIQLSKMRPGQEGIITFLSPESRFRERLIDLGFVPGEIVRVQRMAPLGDPIEYEVRSTRVCIRRREAELIRVLLPLNGKVQRASGLDVS